MIDGNWPLTWTDHYNCELSLEFRSKMCGIRSHPANTILKICFVPCYNDFKNFFIFHGVALENSLLNLLNAAHLFNIKPGTSVK